MSRDQKVSICHSIAEYWNQLLSLRFDALGSLCIDAHGEITVGPLSMMCSISGGDHGYPSPEKCGPFSMPRDWILAMANGDCRYKTGPFPASTDSLTTEVRSQEQSRVETNVALLTKLPLSYKGNAIHPLALYPPDFRMHNVIVSRDDPTKIMGVIDWEGTQTAPIWNIRKKSFFNLAEPEEQADLDGILWERVSELNSEWAEAMILGASLRDAAMRASLSDCDPRTYNLELPDIMGSS
ncbi:hypothetical protein B0H11DRAFT_1925598 [Mycena galericulata]|nr:hypothetical protein B0H11DRAFT_1925598 [Mycena galericulata]